MHIGQKVKVKAKNFEGVETIVNGEIQTVNKSTVLVFTCYGSLLLHKSRIVEQGPKIAYKRTEKVGLYNYEIVRYSNGHYGLEGLFKTFPMLGELRSFLLAEQA